MVLPGYSSSSAFLLRAQLCPLLPFLVGDCGGGTRPGSSDLCYYKCANRIEVIVLLTLPFSQSAVTCLQWPMEYNIAFGLAEGKVKDGREPQERLGVGIIVMKKEIWLMSFRVELCAGGECTGTSFFLFLFFSFSFFFP